MKITVKELAEWSGPLARICQKDIPAPTSYKLAMLSQQIAVSVKIYHETLSKLLTAHAAKIVPIAGTELVSFNFDTPEKNEAFMAEYEPLSAQEAEVDFEPISITALGNASVKPDDITTLGKIIKA